MGARHFLHPVSLSRKIMEESHHCALSGYGAVAFAEKIGFPICEPKDLITDEIRAKAEDFTYDRYLQFVKYFFEGGPVPETGKNGESGQLNCTQDPLSSISSDTVSAVALDSKGHFACATSTGNI
jgi:isoaspartyl peptidase/L-asparaginase-like protein (Ntn-hydrolase superfamily)